MNKEKDFQAFKDLMAILYVVFDQPESKAKNQIYFDLLKTFELNQIQTAIYQSVKTLKSFPRPVNLLEILSPPTQNLINLN